MFASNSLCREDLVTGSVPPDRILLPCRWPHRGPPLSVKHGPTHSSCLFLTASCVRPQTVGFDVPLSDTLRISLLVCVFSTDLCVCAMDAAKEWSGKPSAIERRTVDRPVLPTVRPLSCRLLTIHTSHQSLPPPTNLGPLPPISAHPQPWFLYPHPKFLSNRLSKLATVRCFLFRHGPTYFPSLPPAIPSNILLLPSSSPSLVFLSCTSSLSASCGVSQNRKFEEKKCVHGRTSLHLALPQFSMALDRTLPTEALSLLSTVEFRKSNLFPFCKNPPTNLWTMSAKPKKSLAHPWSHLDG